MEQPANPPDPAAQEILKSLRIRVLDESEPLAGLLRAILMLGSVTGSDSLRTWASSELRGYEIAAPLPDYRQLSAALCVNTPYGPGQTISRLQVPAEFRGAIPELLPLRSPLDELEKMAEQTNLRLSYEGFPAIAAQWSTELPMFQAITALYYRVPASTIAGMLGRIRTTLVELVAELASEVPFDGFPTRAQVDSAVTQFIQVTEDNSLTVGGNNYGVAGRGTSSTQTQQIGSQTIGFSDSGVVELITRLRTALPQIEDLDDRADAEQALDDLEEAVTEATPEPDKVNRRWRAVERVAAAIPAMKALIVDSGLKDAVASMLGIGS